MKMFIFCKVMLIFLNVLHKSYTDEILGCGGYVKSNVTLDWSQIKITLYNKETSIETVCASTSRYYFLPVSDKGKYTLEIHPPSGWSFEPSKYDLYVDGETDPCSLKEDINFTFKGFGITGKVNTEGQSEGPKDVSIQLIDDKNEVRKTVTAIGGYFHFTPVIPGKYTIRASHPKLKLNPSEVVVQVKEGNTELPEKVLVVRGYEVRGSVTSNRDPFVGLHVLLYSKQSKLEYKVEGCQTALLQGVPGSPICYAVSDQAGEFAFGLVPAGDYKLLALEKSPGLAVHSLDIQPKTVEISVLHNSLYLKNAFEVKGFSVVGSVLKGPGLGGLSGVQVLTNGKPQAVSDSSGKFTLSSLHVGEYTLSFKHELCKIEDITLQVTSSGVQGVVTAYASAWRVCGHVTPPRDVIIENQRVHTQEDGKWCTYLAPGEYKTSVDISEQEIKDGLQFTPDVTTVKVVSAPVSDVTFARVRARVWGRAVIPPAACARSKVLLRRLTADGDILPEERVAALNAKGEYVFEEVSGRVQLEIVSDSVCWRETRRVLDVRGDTRAPDFEHAGHAVHVTLSHDAQIEYSGANDKGAVEGKAGSGRVCVARAQPYVIRAHHKCHQFAPVEVTVDTTDNSFQSAEFKAVLHANKVLVTAPRRASDVTLRVVGGGREVDVGPLTARTQEGGVYHYEHMLYLTEGETATVEVRSTSITGGGAREVVGGAGEGGCDRPVLTIPAEAARVYAGRITPPVDGVLVELIDEDTNEVVASTTAGADGSYSLGAVSAARRWRVRAARAGYALTGPDDAGNFRASRLADLALRIVDDADDSPLQGVVVSVSGGQYRRNAASDADGRLTFGPLAPGDYFVKPLLKEYRFEPAHRVLTVLDGQRHDLVIRGVRVAWSCAGRVRGLGGAGRGGVPLRAEPRPSSAAATACRPEHATTDDDGTFRIRGLLPNCVYGLEIKETALQELSGLKIVKGPKTIEVKENKDIENVEVIVIQPQRVTDVNVMVTAPHGEHYRSLRLTVSTSRGQSSPVYSARLDSGGHGDPGVLHVLPRLPADGAAYVITLESTLSKKTYDYEDEVVFFNSDGGFKHFDLEFKPKVKASEQELRQFPVAWVLVAGAAAVLGACVRRRDLASRLAAVSRAAKKKAA